MWVNRDAKISSAMEAKRTWPNKSATLSAISGHPQLLILAHRRRTKNSARCTKGPFGRACDGDEPLVITSLGDELKTDRHAEAIKAHRQGRGAQCQIVRCRQIVDEVTLARPDVFRAQPALSGHAV